MQDCSDFEIRPQFLNRVHIERRELTAVVKKPSNPRSPVVRYAIKIYNFASDIRLSMIAVADCK